MIKIKDVEHKIIEIDNNKTKEYGVKFEKLKKGEKISILSDAMFKCMFVNSSRLKYGAKLISYFVDVTYEELLQNIKLINSELNKDVVSSKNERCDYVAEINDSIINIEINCNATIDTLKRNIDYAHRLFARNIKAGSEYDFTQIIQLNLNNFTFEDNDKVFDIYYIQNDNNELLTNNLIFVQISIPNLRKKWYTEGVKSLNEGERFILSLVETNIDEAKNIGMEDDFMQESIKEQVKFCLDEDLRESYDHELAWKEEWRRQGHCEGVEEGMKKGIEKGLKKGRKEGREEGREEGLFEAAQKMISKGMSAEETSQILNVDIEKLKKNL